MAPGRAPALIPGVPNHICVGEVADGSSRGLPAVALQDTAELLVADDVAEPPAFRRCRGLPRERQIVERLMWTRLVINVERQLESAIDDLCQRQYHMQASRVSKARMANIQV